MKKNITITYIFLLVNFLAFSQSNGVKSFEIPAQNSLKFNKFLINPTFSFVKEEDPYISIFNKRQWSDFENAPVSYLLNYSTKFADNNAFSVGAFQQDYSIITSQGALLNYARNVEFDEDSNLTFGLNLSVFKTGINTSKIITNFPDPLIANFQSSTILAINPGINYGTDILDFGLSAKNLVQYNFSTSQNVALDPLKSFQGHVMYTGYLESSDFLDQSKFTALARVESRREQLVLSGNLLLDIPNLGWGQAGYNTIDGISAGLGFNITRNFSLGYNFDRGIGESGKLGFAHEFVLAYYFKESEERSDGGPIYVTKPVVVTPVEKVDNAQILAEAKARADAEAKFLADKQKAQEAKLKAIADAKIKAEADAIAYAEKQKLTAQANADKAKADAEAKIISDRQKIEDAKAKAIVDAAKAKADAAAKLIADAQAKANKIKADAEVAKNRAIEDAKAKAEAIAQAKIDAAEVKAQAAANAKALAIQQKAEADAAKLKGAEAAKLLAEAKAKADKQKAEADAIKAAALAESNKAKAAAAKVLADQQKADADVAKAQAAADAKAKADQLKAEADATKLKGAEAAKLLADAKAKADKEKADALAESNKAKAEAAKILADQQKATAETAKLKAAADAKLLAEAKAIADKEKADATAAKALALADAAKAKSDAAAKLIADAAKAKADTAAKILADAKAKSDKEKVDADNAKAKAAADAAKAKADADAKALADANKSETDKSLDYVKKIIDETTNNSKALLTKLAATVDTKEKDLKDLKEENDLGDKGIVKAPKPFQSASEANKALESLKNELTESTKQQAGFITQYQELLDERLKKVTNRADPVNVSYIAAINKLKADQLKNEQLKSNLITKLDKIKTDIDIEKKRRIKRAAFESGQSRYDKDRAALKLIKETTQPTKTTLSSSDFDFGADDQNNMQILKKIENTQPGFYLILAVHTDASKRDAFLTKLVSMGVVNADFFFDIVSGKYFIYAKKYESIDEISIAMENKGKKPYDAKMFIVKLEN